MGTPDRECSVETVADYLLDVRSLEDLQLLLTEEEAWKQFVAGVDLSREEEDALREALDGIFADPDAEDEEGLQCDLWHKETFLDAYPRVILELEKRIRKLHALADKVDKVHRDCTISQVVASSSSVVSGVLTILGLALAPVTAAVSLALSATGLGLGAAAVVTGVSTSIVKKVKEAFGGTALAMTKGARIMGAATAGLFLLMGVVSLVGDSKHLHAGAKTKSAAELLRQQALNLEQKLQELIRVHDSLIR